MKVGDLVEWKGHMTTTTWAIYKAGKIGVVTDTMLASPYSGHRWTKDYCRVLFPAPAGELVVRPCFLKALS